MKNFYEVLQVRTNATAVQIKKSFLELVSKYHPDVYEGDKLYAERYTALLTEAYSILKDPEKRFEYDLKHNINTRPSMRELRREDREIRRQKREDNYRHSFNKNYEQEMSMKYFKNAERKKPKKTLLKRILTSKLFYCLLFVFGMELLIVFLFYFR